MSFIKTLNCRYLMKNLFVRLLFLCFLLGGNVSTAQNTLSVRQVGGISAPGSTPGSPVVLSATCPTSAYVLVINIKNESGAPITNISGASLKINIKVGGSNAAANGGSTGVTTSFTVGTISNGGNKNFSLGAIDLSAPGPNTLTISITTDSPVITGTPGTETGTQLDDNIVSASIVTNPIASSANLDAIDVDNNSGTSICEGELITISSSGGSSYHFFLNNAPLTLNPSLVSSFARSNFANGDVVKVKVVLANGCIVDKTLTFNVSDMIILHINIINIFI